METPTTGSALLQAMIATMLLCDRLRGSETRVLHSITRESLLVGKVRAKISFTQLGELSGLTRPAAARAVKSLIEIGYVIDDEGAWRLDLVCMMEATRGVLPEVL